MCQPRSAPQKHFLILISVRRLSQPQSHSVAGRIRQIEKNSITLSGLEPMTFRLVAQCPNQLHYHVPQSQNIYVYYFATLKPCDATKQLYSVQTAGHENKNVQLLFILNKKKQNTQAPKNESIIRYTN
jgi:hypothetical protein